MNSTIMVEKGEEEEEVDLEQLKTLMTIVPIIVPILFTFVIVIGLVGNLLVVLVVLLNKTMRNTTNILIFNLAVSQICTICEERFRKKPAIARLWTWVHSDVCRSLQNMTLLHSQQIFSSLFGNYHNINLEHFLPKFIS